MLELGAGRRRLGEELEESGLRVQGTVDGAAVFDAEGVLRRLRVRLIPGCRPPGPIRRGRGGRGRGVSLLRNGAVPAIDKVE
jgi:hypothetical protein